MSPSDSALARPAFARRRAAAAIAIACLALSACGQDSPGDSASTSDGSADEEGVSLRFSWWGSDARQAMNQELIDLYEEDHPGVTVDSEYSDFSGYWDKLATQTAGGDAPDVIMQEERYLRDYASRGALADLAEYDIDTSEMAESVLESGQFDGGLWGIPTGVNAYALVANPSIFADAGVPMPDDETWTWEDYARITAEISSSTPDGVYGIEEYGFDEPALDIFARQRGESLWTEDGRIGMSPETIAERWQLSLDLMESGAAPPASESLETRALSVEQSLLSTNQAAMRLYWTNQLGTVNEAAGQEMELLRLPGETQYDRTGLFLKPSMALSMAATTDHPEEAAEFIDWMLNSPEAGEIILMDRGLPSNLEVRESIMDQLGPADQQASAFVDELTPTIVDAPEVPPVGAGEVNAIIQRINDEVMFGRISPQEAAEQFIAEAEAATAS